jgi:hypothetical protein
MDQYLDDISNDELSAHAPPNKTIEAKNARRTRNQKRADRRFRNLQTLPVCNLTETLDEVAARPHETPEQCLTSINRIG